MVAGIVSVLSHDKPPTQIAPPALVADSECLQPPVFKPGYQLGENFVTSQGEGFKFGGESWIEANLCSPGTLKITADGELGGEEKPKLTVLRDNAVLHVAAFDAKKTIEVYIPRSGSVYLAYFNDYYVSDARVATFREFKFTGSNCETLKSVTVPRESGGWWDQETGAASLVFAVPMTVVPCGPGRLSVLIIGRAGKKIFPELTFEQGGKVIRQVATSSSWQLVQLMLGPGPLTITLKNPYFAALADRNLNVQSIEFTPGPP